MTRDGYRGLRVDESGSPLCQQRVSSFAKATKGMKIAHALSAVQRVRLCESRSLGSAGVRWMAGDNQDHSRRRRRFRDGGEVATGGGVQRPEALTERMAAALPSLQPDGRCRDRRSAQGSIRRDRDTILAAESPRRQS